jgi:hypothetical protein
MVGEQVQVALGETTTCPACEAAHRHKDTRQIVVRTLFGVLRLASPRWWHCSCPAHEAATFSPLAELLPERTTESTVNQVISKRMVKKQQMRWTPRGAHLLLQIRTRVLNDQLADDFHRWHPGFTHCSPDAEELAATA